MPCIVILLSFTTSCYVVHTVPTAELTRLHGYDVHDEHEVPITTESRGGPMATPGTPFWYKRTSTHLEPMSRHRVVDIAGVPRTFSSKYSLVLVLDDDSGPVVLRHKYRSIAIANGVFQGVTMMPPSKRVAVPVAEVQEFGLQEFSKGRTAWAIIAGSVALGAINLLLTEATGMTDYRNRLLNRTP